MQDYILIYLGQELKMSHRKLTSLIMIAALLLTAVSCKEDKDTADLPSLSGLVFSCPSFVAPGTEVTLTPKGFEHPEGKGVGIYWKVTPSMAKADTTMLENGLTPEGKETDGSLEFQFSDTLGKYQVMCYAFAEGHSGDAYQKTVMVVEGGLDKSITMTDIKETDPKVTVDGVDYYYQEIAGLDWFRRNLASEASGVGYQGYDVTSDVFGRYYSYEEALTACPEGWRLPSEEDWLSMCAAIGASGADKYGTVKNVASMLFVNACFNDEPMLEYWPQVGEVTNRSGLCVFPVGYSNLGDRSSEGVYPYAAFGGMYEYAAFWTADKVAGEEGMAYYRYLVSDQPDFFVGKGDVKSFGASVRCVRDAE